MEDKHRHRLSNYFRHATEQFLTQHRIALCTPTINRVVLAAHANSEILASR